VKHDDGNGKVEFGVCAERDSEISALDEGGVDPSFGGEGLPRMGAERKENSKIVG
jgi:hypothetical protein